MRIRIVLRLGIVVGCLAWLCLLNTSQAASQKGNRPVTQSQYSKLVRVFKSAIRKLNQIDRRVKNLENKVNRTSGGSGGGASDGDVDLSSLDSNPIGQSAAGGAGSRGGSLPYLKTFFDWNLIRLHEEAQTPWSFKNIHPFLLFELSPSPELQFNFHVSSSPYYYELDYQLNKRLKLRLGKIFIPFDDMDPHNIFGGRTGVSTFSVSPSGQKQFLPNLWAEMGIGVKYTFIDTSALFLEGALQLTNGFQGGGVNPLTNAADASYPDISPNPGYFQISQDGGSQFDNNGDKAISGRLYAKFMNRVGLGGSFYTASFTKYDVTESQRITGLGIDNQLFFGRFTLRSGLATFSVSQPAPASSFLRSGAYTEASYRFGKRQNWTVQGRLGIIQLDDRVVDITDQTIAGLRVLWKPGLIEFSIEHSRDFRVVHVTNASKPFYSYTNLRAVMAF